MRRPMISSSEFYFLLAMVIGFIEITMTPSAEGQSLAPLPPIYPETISAPGELNPSSTTTPELLQSAVSESLDSEPEIVEDFLTPSWSQSAYWFGPVPWDTSIEVGINGSSGTSESFSMRAGGSLKRKSDWNKIDISLFNNLTTSAGVQTQNNAQFDARHDWLLQNSPWTVFIATSLLYDEFQAFDLRWAGNGGLGYQIIDTETTNLIGRFGSGVSREFGGPDDQWTPEALFGLDYDYQISGIQKIYAKADYFPEWGDFTSYRIVSDAGWEFLLDGETNVSLKVSVTDRYDSTPNGAEPNLLNYSISLLWKL